MKNAEIVKILLDIADFLELKEESVFKVRAYQKAARAIEFLPVEIERLVAEGRLREVPGIGEAIEKKITELVTTGRLEYYEELKAEFPAGIGTLLDIPGIGPRTAALIARELKISSADELEKAILDGRVAALPRLGEKTAGNILRAVQALRKKKSEQRIPIGQALP
ncbi:MAG: DNA polymerase III, partial [Chloroflexi bacterium]|nr:DNA polymerase III [Chloroflexota bacterium]